MQQMRFVGESKRSCDIYPTCHGLRRHGAGCRRGPTGGCRGLLRQRCRRLRGRERQRAHRVSPRALAQVWHRLGDPCRQREPLCRGAVLLLQQLEERPQLQHPPGDSSGSRLPQDRATGHRVECLLVCWAGVLAAPCPHHLPATVLSILPSLHLLHAPNCAVDNACASLPRGRWIRCRCARSSPTRR